MPEKLTCQRCKMGLLERALKICDDMGYKERPYFLPKKSSTLWYAAFIELFLEIYDISYIFRSAQYKNSWAALVWRNNLRRWSLPPLLRLWSFLQQKWRKARQRMGKNNRWNLPYENGSKSSTSRFWHPD